MKFLIAATLAVAGAALAVSLPSLGHHSPGADAQQGPRLPSATRTTAAPKTPSATSTPLPPATPGPRNAAARDLDVIVAECRASAREAVRAIFLWGPSRGGSQWLDLSIYNNGFAPGTFVSPPGFNANTWGFVWDGLLQGTTHFARVNTLTADGWKTSETVSFFTPVCDPTSYEVPPADDMLRLRDRMAAAIADSGINTAVAITDLRTGESVDVDGAANRLPGCTINLFGLMRVVVDLQAGRYPEPEPGDLIGQTINRSDPITSRQLVKYWIGGGDLAAGLAAVNDFIASLGMTSTLLDHPPAFPGESLYGYPTENRITALDANRGLRAIWDGRVLQPFWRDYFLQKMTLVKPGLNYLIPIGTSADATVSHKNGFLYQEGWADNDIGIVWYERGGQRYGYAISFFTEGVATKYADIPLGQQISSQAFQWFVGRYGYP